MSEQFDIKAGIKLEKDTEFKSAVTSVNKTLTSLKSELKLVEAQFDGNANSMEALQKKHEVLNKILEEQKKKVENTDKALKNSQKEYDRLGQTLEQALEKYDEENEKLEELKKIYGETSNEVKNQMEVLQRLELQINKGNQEYAKAGDRVKEWENKLNTANSQMIRAEGALNRNAAYMEEASKSTDHCATSIDKFGKSVSNSAVNPIEDLAGALAAAGVAAKISEIEDTLLECSEAANEFETGMAKVKTIADETAVSNEQMKQTIMELSSETGKGAADISEATYQAISAGVDTANAVATVEDAIKLAVGGFTDETTAVDILTTTMNAYNLEADQTKRISDVLITTQNLGKTSVGNLASSMGKVIPLASAYNVQLEDLASAYAVLTANGVKTDESTTYIKAALNELGDTGSTVGKILTEETGMSFAELMNTGMSLGDVIGVLSENVGGNATAFNSLWSSSEAGVGMLSILNSGIDNFNSVLDQMKNSAGAAEAAFETMADTSEYTKQKMENSVNNLKIAIGEELQPVLNNMRKAGSKSFDWATDFIKKNSWVVSAVTGLTTALGVLAGGLAVFTALPKITALFTAFSTALTANPIILITTALAGLVTAFAAYTASLKETESEYQELADNAQAVTDKVTATSQSISEGNQSWAESKSQLEAQGTYAGKLAEELDSLAGIENKSASEKSRMAEIVSTLNKLVPDLNLAFDEEAGVVNKTKEEMLELIEAHSSYAKVSAATERLGEISGQQVDLDLREEEIKQGIKEYEDAIAELDALRETILANSENDMVEYNGQMMTTLGAVTDIASRQQELYDSLDESGLKQLLDDLEEERETLNGQQRAVEEYIKKTNEASNATKETGVVFGETVEATTGLKKSAEEMAEAFLEGKKAASEEEKTVSVLANTAENAGIIIKGTAEDTEEANEKMAESAQKASDIQKSSMRSVLDSYNEMVQSITSDLQNKVSLFDKFDGGTDMTTEKMNANLNDQIENLKKYQENLEKVRNMVDENGKAVVSDEFFQYIQDMGLEGANMLEHMVYTWEEQGEYGAEQIRSMNDQYCEAMDLTEGIARTGAANKIAYESAMREFTSSDADFSDLRDSITYAVQYAGESWNGLSESTRTALEETISTVQECGGQIPEGLAEAIESGETTPEEAIQQLNASLQGQFDALAEIAEENGIQVPEYLKEGIQAGGDDAVKAFAEIIESLAAYNEEFEKAGQENGETFASGVESQAETASEAATSTSDAAVEAVKEAAEEYKTAGDDLIRALAQGMAMAAEKVRTEAANTSESGAASAEGYVGEYQYAGLMLASGFARGIAQGRSQAVNEAVQMAVQALQAAKETLDIHSPSKKFQQDVGEQIPKGMAFGIKNKKVLAKNASAEMSKEVLKNATAWLDSYKESHKVSLDDEKYFWQEVQKRTKKGTSAYKQAGKALANISSEILKIESNFGVSWQKDGKAKDAETYYSEVYSAANKYMSNMKVIRDVDLREEEAYWQAVIKQLKKGTQAWYDAQKQLKSVQSSIKQEQLTAKQEKAQKKQEQKDYAVSGDALETYKTYFDVSAQSEVEYWNIVRKKFKTGTQEREEADKKYFEAKKSLNEQLVALEEDYYNKISEVNDRLEEDIEELTEEYKSAVEDRANAIYSSFGLTDKFESETDDGATLLYNLKTQVVGLEDWQEQLDKLKSKGVDEGFLEELQEMGPEASAMLHVLNNDLPEDMDGKGMTDAELKEYVGLWKQKKEIAQQQAEEENEQLRIENEKKIAELREQAQNEIAAYTEEYLLGVEELTTPITNSLKKVANNALKWGEETVSSFVQGLSKSSTSENSVAMTLKTTSVITKNLANLEKEGKTIGANTLDGILKGMNDSKKIKKSASKLVKDIVNATKKAAKINSPSKLFKEEVGEYIPSGVGEGVEKNTVAAVKPAENMITQMMDAAEAKQQSENEKLSAYMQNMNFDAGIAQINTTLKTPISNTTNVNVDNSALTALFSQFLGKMEEVVQNINEKQIILDDGTLVGRLAPKISQESGQTSRRLNRGKY